MRCKMFNNKWDIILKEETNKSYFKELIKFVDNERKTKTIYPKKDDLFKALISTDYDNVSVVILGQDPYHGEGQSNGLCFSVNEETKIPPSLRNIFKELKEDLNIERTNTDLSDWANQGVLLLNTVLTVEKDKAFSHRKMGWETFTDTIIKKLNERNKPIIFIFWGNAAKAKKKFITKDIHKIIESSHPSPLSIKGFKGSKPFSKANNYLKQLKNNEIKW